MGFIGIWCGCEIKFLVGGIYDVFVVVYGVLLVIFGREFLRVLFCFYFVVFYFIEFYFEYLLFIVFIYDVDVRGKWIWGFDLGMEFVCFLYFLDFVFGFFVVIYVVDMEVVLVVVVVDVFVEVVNVVRFVYELFFWGDL